MIISNLEYCKVGKVEPTHIIIIVVVHPLLLLLLMLLLLLLLQVRFRKSHDFWASNGKDVGVVAGLVNCHVLEEESLESLSPLLVSFFVVFHFYFCCCLF